MNADDIDTIVKDINLESYDNISYFQFLRSKSTMGGFLLMSYHYS